MKKVLLLFFLTIVGLSKGQTILVSNNFENSPNYLLPQTDHFGTATMEASLVQLGTGYNNVGAGLETSLLEGAGYGGYIKVKVSTKGYSNIKVSFGAGTSNRGGNNENSDFWDIYVSDSNTPPPFNVSNTSGYVRSAFLTSTWTPYNLSMNSVASAVEDKTFVYFYIVAYSNKNGQNKRYLAIDDLRITGCKITPPPPLAPSAQTFCSSTNPTVANLNSGASTDNTVRWFTASTGGTERPSTYPLPLGTTILYVEQSTVANAECPSLTSTRTEVTVNVNATPGAPAGNASQTFCSVPTPTVASLTATGSNILWYAGPMGGSPLASTTTLTNGTQYYASQTVNGCESTARFAVTATLNPVSVGGTVSSAQTICAGSRPADLTLSGFNGTIVKWQKSTDNFSTFTDIANTSNTLTGVTIGNLTQSTSFRAVVKSGVCSETPSSPVLITVDSVSVGGTVSGGTIICSGSTSGALTLSGHTGNVVRWESSVAPFSTWTTIAHTSTTYTSGALTQTTHFRAVVQSGSCSTATSEATTVRVDPVSQAGTISENQTVCSGNTAALSISGAVGSLQWQQSLNGSSWTDISGATSANFTTGPLTQTTYYRVKATSGVCSPAYSSSVLVTVNPVSTAGTVSEIQTICSGNTAALSVSGSVGSLQWQQSLDNSTWTDISGATAASYTTAALTQTTYYRVKATSGVCSPAYSSGVLVTVNPVSTAGTVSGNQTICSGNTAALSVSSYVGSLQWQQSFDSANWTDISGATSANYTTAALTQTTYYRVRATSGVCSPAFSASVLVTVNPTIPASVSISAAPNAPICAGTPVIFTAEPTNGGTPSYQWFKNDNPVTGAVNSTYTASDFADGDRVYVQMTSTASPCLVGSPATSNTVVVQHGGVSVYENNKWSIDITQVPNLKADILQSYDTPAGAKLSVCSLHIKNNAQVKIIGGTSIKVQNGVTVDNGSSLTVESDASLVQVNNNPAINTGIITAQRTINLSSGRQQYNYISSPVEGQSLKNIYSGIDYVLYHNEANNFFYSSSGAYIKGRGLAVKEPNKTALPAGNTSVTATFTGYPTNGTFTYSIVNSNISQSKRGFNLIGNPYPSNIDLNAIYTLNGGSAGNLSSTFYFWDNRANSQTVQKGDSYGGQAYAQYNAVSGTGALATGDVNLAGINEPTRIVKMGQAFMVKTSVSAQQLIFNNTIRTADNSPVSFFGKSGKSTGATIDRYWLNLVTPGNLASNIAVVYFEGGTNDFAKDDSSSMGGSDVVYSLVGTEKVSINGRSSFADDDVIPLGTSHFEGGNYTLALNGKEGVFAAGQNIYLKDKQTGLITNLSEGNYTFTANKGESTGRFEIIYRPETVLATDGMLKEEIQVYRDGSFFVVKAQTKKITALELYDAAGRLIEKMQPNNTSVKLNSDTMVTGLYVLKIRQGDETYVKKIIK